MDERKDAIRRKKRRLPDGTEETTTEIIPSKKGAAAGAAAGAVVGSAIPVVGTAVGAGVGAVFGFLFGPED